MHLLVGLLLIFQAKMPPNTEATSLSSLLYGGRYDDSDGERRTRVAILGTGMMGREHMSYLIGYSSQARIDFLCDPHEPSLESAVRVMKEFNSADLTSHPPALLQNEEDLLKHVDQIDLLVIASPNYLHTDQLMRWGEYDITILVEKPVAVSREQHDRLAVFSASSACKARIWVAMEYRYIPAISKLLSLLPTIGDIKMVTIRENRYPFLHKIGAWNRDRLKTGDTLVEKCCHFFDLFRLITGQEATLDKVRALAQRGLNYEEEPIQHDVPIIDSAYVFMPFQSCQEQESADEIKKRSVKTMGCLELCMYAEGSRHQEEIIVTGTSGRLEAYLPENKVYLFERPSKDQWLDRSVPPPKEVIKQQVFDCSDVRSVHGIEGEIPVHGGYHYCSTAVEWFHLLRAMREHQASGIWAPHVSIQDGLRAVEIGLCATQAIVNEQDQEGKPFRQSASMPV